MKISSPRASKREQSTPTAGFWLILPVVTSYCHPCHGHVTTLPSITPCPSGPPRCKQVLLMAKNLPPTFARAIALPSTWNSRIVPGVISFVFAARAIAIVSSLPLFHAFCAPSSRCKNSPGPSSNFPLLSRRWTLRHHHSLLEFIHHLRLQPHFRRPLRQRHLIDLVLQLQQRKKQPFRPWGASYDIHIYRNDLIHTLQHRIRIKRPAHARARSHRNAPLRVRHLFPHALQHRSHLQRHRSCHDHQVRLPRRRPEHFRSEPRHVEPRGCGSNHFDRAACQSKRKRPDGALPRPVEH